MKLSLFERLACNSHSLSPPQIQNLFKLHVNKEEFVAKDTRTMPDEFQKIISRTYVGGIPADIADYAKSKGDIESTDR